MEEAILKALEYENRIRDLYQDAAGQAGDDVGRKVFSVLAEEEQTHVGFLEHKLVELRQTGRAVPEPVATNLPTAEAIAEAVAKLERGMGSSDYDAEVDMLKKALIAEQETSDFYERMVRELGGDGPAFFEPFLEIERSHTALVQAELDALTGMGFWFDMAEFRLESG